MLSLLSSMFIHRWFKAIWILGLLCLGATIPVKAQYQPYQFDHWTTDDGLPQNTITGMTQTRDGYLWLTTFDGVARFDGVRFMIFDKGNTKAIGSNRFTCLYESNDGALLFGTEDGGLVVYSHGVFTSYTTSNGLPSNKVLSITSDLNSEPVIRTNKAPVYLRDGRIVLAPSQYQDPRRRYYQSPTGAQVTITPSNIEVVKDGHEIDYRFEAATSNYFSGVFLFEDSRLNLWLYDKRSVYSLRDGVITPYPQLEGVRPFCEDSEGGIWLGRPIGAKAEGNFLALFKDGRFTAFGEADGIMPSVIYSIIKDREGMIWLATSRGLYRARKRLMSAFSTESGLANHEVYPLMQSRNGEIWIGTAMGVNRAKYEEGKLNVLSLSQSDAIIQSLWEEAIGRVWIGTVGRLRLYENGKVRELLRDFIVFDVKADRDGNYWVATPQGVLKLRDNKIVATYKTKEGLAGDDVKIIHQDRHGDLWFGTYGGLTQLKGSKLINYKTADGLAGNHVRTIYEDAEGTLWIGTYDDGLSRFRDGKFFNYGVEQGLFNNGVFQILEDRRGYFWIGCNKGIYRVSRRELDEVAEGRRAGVNSIAFGKADGMFNAECNGGRQPSGFVAQDGKLWFPTMGGVVVIDPEVLQVNPLPPPVLIESVTLERSLVDFSKGVTVAPGQRDLEIAYTGLSFIKPEQVNFKYKLEGLDTQWVEAGTRRVAYFPNLSPGSYTFLVIAANSDGVWNTTGARVRITVVPPFWRTWWFAMCSLGVVLGAAWMLFRRRIAGLEQERAAQAAFSRQLMQSQEDERKRIAAELHDSLGQSLAIIKNRAQLSLSTPDDHERALEQLREISEASAEVIDEVKEIAHNLRPYQLDRLGLTKTIIGMIQKVSDTSGLGFVTEVDLIDGLFTPEGEINLFRIVQESVNNIVEHAQATEASVTIKKNDRNVIVTIRDNGKGFDEARKADGSIPRGFGLTGMTERANVLGGEYKIQSVPGQGTTITLIVDSRKLP